MLFPHVIVVYFGIFIDSAFSVFKVCPAGMYLQWSECYLCPSGTYQDATGQNSCIQCPAGSYSATSGATFCALCKVGTYQPLEGHWTCFSCGSGQNTYGVGSTSNGDCVTECSAGTYRLNRNSNCEKCPVGSYQPNEGQNSCHPCIAGTYQNQSGQTSCIQCPPGSYQSSFGSESCISCIPGTYERNAGSSNQCLVCPVGTYQESVRAISCNKCVVGMFQNQTGQTKCDPCPEGTYQSSEGANECIACAPGMYQNFTGQSRCIDCPLGSYKAESGPGLCIPCGVGTYQNMTGKISCSECLNGTSTAGLGAMSIKECIMLDTLNTTKNTINKNLGFGDRLTIIIISITLPVTAIVTAVIAITYRRRKAANKTYESTRRRVQLEEQYSTLEDIGLKCTSKGRNEYRIPRGKFVQTYKTLMEVDLKSGKSKLLLNFEKFTSRTRREFVSGTYENTSLISETGEVQEAFISIYSLGERGRFSIVTTLPILSTEFWSCVIKYNIGSIIALGENEETGTCLGKTTHIQCKQFRVQGSNSKVSSGMRFFQLQVSYGEDFEVKKAVIYVTINLGLDEERLPADIRKLVTTYIRSVRSLDGKENQNILIHIRGCNMEQGGRLYNVFSVLHHLDQTEFFDLEMSLKIARIQGVFRVDSFEKYKFLHDVVCQYILYS